MSKLGRFGVVVGALTLTLLFVAARYPWDELAPSVERLASEAAGVRIDVAAIGFGLGSLGAAAHATDVRIAWPAGQEIRFERVSIRPAFSLAWLSGEPRLRILTVGGPGDFDGVAGRSEIDGSFQIPEASALPWTVEPPITGPVDGNLALSISSGQPTGTIHFEASDGSLLPPGLPVAIPFDRLSAELALDASGLSLAPLVVEGPLAAGKVAGTVVPQAGRWEAARLDLVVDLDHFDPGLGRMMQSYGMKLSAGSRLTIQGTAANPRIR